VATFGALQLVAARAVGLVPLEQVSSDELGRLRAAVNRAIRDIALARPWPRHRRRLSLALVSGESGAVLPADFQRFERGARLVHGPGSNETVLGLVGRWEIDTLRADGTTSGTPTLYALSETDASGGNAGRRRIEVWPTADGNFTLVGTYRARPTDLVADADAADLDADVDAALDTAVRVRARQEFDQAPPEDWEALLARDLELGWNAVSPEELEVLPLRDVIGRAYGYPQGRRITLTPGQWPNA
jgi:hypothetical protein